MDQNVSALVSAVVGATIRHGMTGLGSVLGVQGLAADNNVNLVTGTAMLVISVVWSFVEKYFANKNAAAAAAAKVVVISEVPHV